MKPDYKITRPDYKLAVDSKLFTDKELELIDNWLELKLTIKQNGTEFHSKEKVGMSISKASCLINKSDEWLRNKVKRGEVIAYRCALGYCVPIEAIIKLKKELR